MKKKYTLLENEKDDIKDEIKDNKIEIASLEKKIRRLKSKNSKLQVKIAEINGEQIKIVNNGKSTNVYLNTTKGMI